ncbi:hypothetical protein [Dysgonomonas sp.]|uniref:hypothetical protein n=1 Tax=Dysgonomonas sp. TaxID=1891233 RepID=UPI0027B9AD74|nr:hypothetical protein [Dysgonomonas sp.]
MSKDKAEEKPYLQDLFEHMNNEHGLILAQSEMLEILSISGKEYDNVQFELGEIERQSSSLSTENAQLREALREILESFNSDLSGLTRGKWEDLMNRREDSLNRAKQLLTDNTKEDEKY